MAEILVARRSFITRQKGVQVHVYRGDHAHADHPVVQTLPDAFRPIDVKFATEEAKPARSAKKGDGTPVP